MFVSFIFSKKTMFKFASALLFSVVPSVMFFVTAADVSLIGEKSGPNTFSYLHENSVFLAYLVIRKHLLDVVTRLTHLNFSNQLFSCLNTTFHRFEKPRECFLHSDGIKNVVLGVHSLSVVVLQLLILYLPSPILANLFFCGQSQ